MHEEFSETALFKKYRSAGLWALYAFMGLSNGLGTNDPVDPREVPLVKAIIQFKRGQKTEKELEDKIYKVALSMRNDAMRKKQYTRIYGKEDFDRYENQLPQFKDRAREKLAQFLGYVPDIQHSLDAELILRTVMYIVKDDPDPQPYRENSGMKEAKTIVEYRKVLLEKGLEAADNSPLVAVEENYINKRLASSVAAI